MADFVRSPGIDSRTWVVIARVDEEEDAIRYAADDQNDAGPLGWLVDVTIQGGPLDQEPIDGCRVATYFGGNGTGRIDPIEAGCLVVVVLPSGNGNDEPTIVGVLDSVGCVPPTEVNGTTIDEEYALATHILVTDKAVDEQVAGDIRVRTEGTHRVLGENVELADEGASQAYVRGDDQNSALDTWYEAFISWIELVRLGISAAGGSLDNTAITQATTQLITDLDGALSTRIKGE